MATLPPKLDFGLPSRVRGIAVAIRRLAVENPWHTLLSFFVRPVGQANSARVKRIVMRYTLVMFSVLMLTPITLTQDQMRGSPRFFKIPANTAIRVRTKNVIFSETAHVGDDVQMEVLGDVIVNGYVVVHQGASAIGQISQVKEARSLGRRGSVALTLSYVEAVTGEHVPVSGNRSEKGKGNAAQMTAEVVAVTALTGAVGAYLLFETGDGTTMIDLSNLPATPLMPPTASQAGVSAGLPIANATTLSRPTASSPMTIPSLGIVVATRVNLGAEIVGIARESRADQAGLRVGYVIHSVDGKEIRSAPELSAALADRAAGSRIRLRYMFQSYLGWMPAEEKVLTLKAN